MTISLKAALVETPIWLIVSDGRCDTSHGYSAASADEAVSFWRKATGSAADANAIRKEGRFALVPEDGGIYSLADTKLKLDVAVRRYWEENQRQPGIYVLATGLNGGSPGRTGFAWEIPFRPVEPDWFILTVHKDIATDLGEGPFDSEEQAREFAEAEVGATWVLFQAPPGTVPALEKDRDRDYGKPVEKRLSPRPEPGNWYVLGIGEDRLAHVSKGPWETPRKAGRYRHGSEVFFRAPHGTREAFDQIQWTKGAVQPKPGGRDALLHKLFASAAAHGRESDPEHEIGDLDLFLRDAWGRLTPAQQRAFYGEHVPKGSAASRAKGDRIWKVLLHAKDRTPAREVANLQGILKACWARLTPEQQRKTYDAWAVEVDFWLAEGGG